MIGVRVHFKKGEPEEIDPLVYIMINEIADQEIHGKTQLLVYNGIHNYEWPVVNIKNIEFYTVET